MRCGSLAASLLLAFASLLTCPSPLLAPGPPPPPRPPLPQGAAQGGHVLCPDAQTNCPALTSTCCLQAGPSKRYVCCPFPKAVCCEGGLHCCPQCFTCSPRTDSCLRPAAAAATVKITSLLPAHPPASPAKPGFAAQAAAVKASLNVVKAPAAVPQVQAKKQASGVESEGFVSGFFSAVKSTLFSSGSTATDVLKPTDSQTIPSKPAILHNIPLKPVTQGVGAIASPNPNAAALNAAAASRGNPLSGGIPQKHQPVLSKSPNVAGGAGPALANQNRGLQQQPNKPAAVANQQKQQLQQQLLQQHQQKLQQQAKPQAGFQGTLKTGIQQPSIKLPVQPIKPLVGQQTQPIKTQAPPIKIEEKEKGGFFSSVLSAVTDKFYTNKKEADIPAEATPKPPISAQKPQLSTQFKPQIAKPPLQQPGGVRPTPAAPSSAPHIPTSPRGAQGIPQRGGIIPPKPVDTRTGTKLPTPQAPNIRSPPPAKPIPKLPLAQQQQSRTGVQQKLGHASAVKIGVAAPKPAIQPPKPAVKKSPAVVLKPVIARAAAQVKQVPKPVQKPIRHI